MDDAAQRLTPLGKILVVAVVLGAVGVSAYWLKGRDPVKPGPSPVPADPGIAVPTPPDPADLSAPVPDGSDHNTITNNTARNNRSDGFVVFFGNENTFASNTARDNGGSGFLTIALPFGGGGGTVLTSNTARDNGGSGFGLQGTSSMASTTPITPTEAYP